MKFRKLNVENCFVYKKIQNIADTLDFLHTDPKKIIRGSFSEYSIEITFENIRQPTKKNVSNNLFLLSNKSDYSTGYSKKTYYSCTTTIYDILVDKAEDNIVYSYYYFGNIFNDGINGKEAWQKSEITYNKNIKKMEKANKEIMEIKQMKTKKGLQKAKEDLSDAERAIKYSTKYDFVELSRIDIINIAKETNDKYFLFNGELYYVNMEKDPYRYTQKQLEILLKESVYKENSKFEKLQKQIEIFEKISTNNDEIKKREPIPEEVKFEVWRRDEGKCVNCGSKENLEFDHIIPFSKGGSNTVRNLQLLCESCNRKKSDKI